MGRGRRGTGFRAEMEIEGEDKGEGVEGPGDWGSTGILREAAVEGLMSWVGEGARLREADCKVEVRVAAALEAMLK